MANLFKTLFFIFTVICFVAAVQGQGQQCGRNQEWTSCGTACPPKCNEEPGRACTLQCIIGCQCKRGYLLNRSGECVAARDC